jgi:hypothetical protein
MKKTYHIKSELSQFKNIYQSTIEFKKFLNKYLENSKRIIDVGMGLGGTLSHYTKLYKNTHFIGIDYRKENVDTAKKLYQDLNIDQNTTFIKINVLKKINNKKLKNIDGIMSEKTFCTFKNIEKPLKNLIKLKPKWIGINSLFFKGYMDVLIHQRRVNKNKFKILNPDDDPDGDFNIHSLKSVKNALTGSGYKISKFQFFFPKKKLKFNPLFRGTYTMKTELNKNTCFSGPVHLPWGFLLIKKK